MFRALGIRYVIMLCIWIGVCLGSAGCLFDYLKNSMPLLMAVVEDDNVEVEPCEDPVWHYWE